MVTCRRYTFSFVGYVYLIYYVTFRNKYLFCGNFGGNENQCRGSYNYCETSFENRLKFKTAAKSL